MQYTVLRAGDTWKFTRTDLSSYPATQWTLTYYLLKKGNQIKITATADGDNYAINVAKSVTRDYPPGQYTWIAKVSRGDEEYTVDSGAVEILPDFADAVSGYDTRSQVKRILDAIEATLEGRATIDQQSYSIAGRTLAKIPIPDLIALRDKYKMEYQMELKAERLKNNLATGSKVMVRFTG